MAGSLLKLRRARRPVPRSSTTKRAAHRRVKMLGRVMVVTLDPEHAALEFRELRHRGAVRASLQELYAFASGEYARTQIMARRP